MKSFAIISLVTHLNIVCPKIRFQDYKNKLSYTIFFKEEMFILNVDTGYTMVPTQDDGGAAYKGYRAVI